MSTGRASQEMILLPRPRLMDVIGGSFELPDRGSLEFIGLPQGEIHLLADPVMTALNDLDRVGWNINPEVLSDSDPALSGKKSGIRLRRIDDPEMHRQGYHLVISGEGIDLSAATNAGLFYGAQTRAQILHQAPPTLPRLRIEDRPDFPNRGVMLDISRDKVPTMDTLFSLVDLLSSMKINQFQLYTEHTFAYQKHPAVWADASPITAAEIQALDQYCRQRFIELVPNQNSFGHMHRWLVHPNYNHLAECPRGCDTAWGYLDEPFSLSPAVPETTEFISGLYDELLPNFSSSQFNVGCDETFDLGQGRSKALVARRGAGRVYLDFLLKIYELVRSHGRAMQFWGDIVRSHPDLVPELPDDLVALEWGYEAYHFFDRYGALFARSKVPFYVCPGTSSWNSVAGRTNNAMANLLNAAENGLKHGAAGYLNTDWGDNGHWQPLPVSYLGYAYGAAVSWALEANRDVDVQAALNAFAFRDSAGAAGKISYDLGNVYESTKVQLPNKTVLFRVLQDEPAEILALVCPDGDTESVIKQFRTTEAIVDGIASSIPEITVPAGDSVLVQNELSWVSDMLRHACHRTIWALQRAQGNEDRAQLRKLQAEAEDLITGHENIWHARNRPGGFKDSEARLIKMAAAYHQR